VREVARPNPNFRLTALAAKITAFWRKKRGMLREIFIRRQSSAGFSAPHD